MDTYLLKLLLLLQPRAVPRPGHDDDADARRPHTRAHLLVRRELLRRHVSFDPFPSTDPSLEPDEDKAPSGMKQLDAWRCLV